MYSENDWRLYLSHSDEEIDKHKYGVPQQKKFPLPDADHVRSAIRFFNYVDPKYEKELASAIIRRMKEYGLTFDDFTVGDENRFKKYVPERELYHYGVKGQKWHVRNGPPYPLNSDKLASIVHNNASDHIEQIANDVKTAAKKSGSKLHGLENRLKTEESIKRKIEKKSAEDNITKFKASTKIKDAVRFTTVSDTKDFVSNYIKFRDNMEMLGYTEIRCKNYFDMYNKGLVKHKSVQSTFASPDGYEFEVQFHTPESQDAKDKKVPIYEERRQVNISPERAAYLEKQMVELAERVPTPNYISRIKTH